MPRSFLIDTDTASDDAVALIMALRAPDVEVKALTLVGGNVPVEQGTLNALYTSELCGATVPVYVGASKPLTRPIIHAHWFHGLDGMGDMHYPAPQRRPESMHAVDAIIETVQRTPGIVIVTLGPLTNIALAVLKAPNIVENVSRCIVMGGAACTVGNVTPAAEYNMWVDPEAARIVFKSGLPIEMVGWEHCRGDAVLFPEEMAAIRAFKTPLATFALDCNRRALEATQEQSGEAGLALPDPVAMAVALDPSIVLRSSQHYVEVETQSELTRGMTVVDQLNVTHDPRNQLGWGELHQRSPNVNVVWQIDVPRWKELLYGALR